VDLPRWHNDAFGQATRAGKTDLVVTSLTQVRQTTAAIPAGSAGEDTFDYHPLSRPQRAYLLSHSQHLSRPLVTWDQWVTKEALRPGTQVEFYVTATDTHRARTDEDIPRPRDGRRHLSQTHPARALKHNCLH
jgi:hypothetical protein